jgi:hypothetical protein
MYYYLVSTGPQCTVGIATLYRLEGPAIESHGQEVPRNRPDRPWGQHSPCKMGTAYLPGR